MRRRIKRRLIRVYTVCNSSSNIYTEHRVVNCTCSNFRTSMVRSWGVRILRVNTVYMSNPMKKRCLRSIYEQLYPNQPANHCNLIKNFLYININYSIQWFCKWIARALMRLRDVQSHQGPRCPHKSSKTHSLFHDAYHIFRACCLENFLKIRILFDFKLTHHGILSVI